MLRVVLWYVFGADTHNLSHVILASTNAWKHCGLNAVQISIATFYARYVYMCEERGEVEYI